MGMQKQYGFTIIEVMLFVAISAVITTAALIGWSVNVNSQSYRDSARSLASVLGQQYANTLNVSNDRPMAQKCTNSNVEDTDNDTNGIPIGQSDCVLMGRYIVMNGSKLTMSNIIGIDNPNTSDTSDIVAIQHSIPTVDNNVNSTSYSIPWSSRPYASSATRTTTMKVVMAVVRSPISGTVYTFTKSYTGDPPLVSSVISSENQQPRTICLDPEATVTGGSLAVVIDKNAASSSAVSVSSGESSCGKV